MITVPAGSRVFLHQAFRCCPYAGMVSSQTHDYLVANGFVVVTDPALADAHIVNTCGSDARQANLTWKVLDELQKSASNAVIVATGCLVSIEAKTMARRVSSLPKGAAFDPRHLAGLDEVFRPATVPFSDVQPALHNEYSGNDFADGWTHILASTGCLGACSFCAIRRATGRPKSRSIAEILEDVRRAVASGSHDLLLVSTDMSAWGTDLGQSVVDVLGAVAAEPGDFLVSAESFEPTLFLQHFDALLPILATGRFAFLGIPIQSGSKRVLESMARSYHPRDVLDSMRAIRERAPNILLRTDILYGFGDESEEEFEESVVASRVFDLPSFNAYQQRPGTPPVVLASAVLSARRERALGEMQRRAQAGIPGVRRWSARVEMAVPPLLGPPPEGAPVGDWEPVGAHAGVRVWREDNQGVRRFLKVYDEAGRGRREAALLGAGLPFRVPTVLGRAEFPEGGALILEDVRRGAPRPAQLPAEGLPTAAALLGALHGMRFPEAVARELAPARAWTEAMRRRFRDESLPEKLRARLAALAIVADAPCHLDLHPSNWMISDGRPVGLLDFASAGWADPEFDLAAAILAAGGDPEAIPGTCAVWGEASGRVPDPGRVALYLWLLAAERRLAKRTTHPREEAIAAAALAGVPNGTARHERAFSKQEWLGAWRPEVGYWRPVDDDGGAILRAIGLPLSVTGSYQRHACNDVLRVRARGLWSGDYVLKVYNKPVVGILFELETYLSEALAGTAAMVAAPVELPGGLRLFRVEGRLAGVYPFLGDGRPGNSTSDMVLLAGALAALHGVAGLAERFPEIARRADDLPWEVLSPHLGDLGAKAEPIVEAYRWAIAEIDGTTLEERLCHGSLHRDHAALLPGGRLGILDLEKAHLGPRLTDLVKSAVYAGYRGNDERAEPGRILYFVRAYHRKNPLTPAEIAAVPASIVLELVRDVKALGQDGAPIEQRLRHAAVVGEFMHNRDSLGKVVRAQLS